MVERLTNLIAIFQKPELDFSQNRAEHDDILGDAYEYLMRHFATESGKSKGQFYTPSEVSRVIAKVIGISPQNTKAVHHRLRPDLRLGLAAAQGRRRGGQAHHARRAGEGRDHRGPRPHEHDPARLPDGQHPLGQHAGRRPSSRTASSCAPTTTSSPIRRSPTRPGPPASRRRSDPFQRFAWGVPPAKQGDYAYLLHIIRSMKSTGKAACILPHGVLFRGNAEAVIRQQLVRSGYPQGHHRPARQSLLRHRHPRLHRRARQGERRRRARASS